MVDPTGLKLVLSVAGGLALLGGTWLFLGERAPQPETAAATGVQAEVIGGVQPQAYDSPFRDRDARDGDDPPAPPTLPTIVADASPPAADPPERGQPPEPPPPPPVLDDAQLAANAAHEQLTAEARKQAATALRGAKGKLKSACWQSGAGDATFSYNMSYGADGKLLAMGISEPRTAGAGAIGACLRSQAVQLDIPPPGKSVTVDVDLAVP
jgi:hypothetical protein